MFEENALVMQASAKRVVSNGDSNHIVLDLGPGDWARFVERGYHKPGTPLLITVRPQQEQMEWTPPEAEAAGANGNGHKPHGPNGGGCYFGDYGAFEGYFCKDEPGKPRQTPCEHYHNPDDDGSVAEAADEQIAAGDPTCGLQDGVWYCADLPGVRVGSACEHMMIPEPKVADFYGRRRINGVLVDGRDPCENPNCGKRRSKNGHRCAEPKSYTTDDGGGVRNGSEGEAVGA